MDVDCAVPLITRPMTPEDRNFVLSSWLRSYAEGSGQHYPGFYEDYAPIVRALVGRSSVLIASLESEPTSIVGWMAVEGDALHYVHVKPRWRRMGVASWLLKDCVELSVIVTHLTRVVWECPRPKGWAYRRYRIWPAEEKAA